MKRCIGALVGMAMGGLVGLGIAFAGAGNRAILWSGIIGGIIFFIGPGKLGGK